MYDELNVVPDIDTMDSGRKLADKDIPMSWLNEPKKGTKRVK